MAIIIHVLGSILGAILPLIILPLYGKTRNVGNLFLVFWLFFINVFLLNGSIEWSGNTLVHHQKYCDFATRLMVGFFVALPLSSIFTAMRHFRVSRACESDKKKWSTNTVNILEGVLCAVVPVIYIAFHILVQEHRFDIVEDYGCIPSVLISVPAIFVLWIPVLLLSTAVLVLFLYSVRHYALCHELKPLKEHLHGSGSLGSVNHHFRVMAMSVCHAILAFGLAVSAMIAYGHNGFLRYPGVSALRASAAQVGVINKENVAAGLPVTLGLLEYAWWVAPVSSYILFGLNFGTETRDIYERAFQRFPRKELVELWRAVAAFFKAGKFRYNPRKYQRERNEELQQKEQDNWERRYRMMLYERRKHEVMTHGKSSISMDYIRTVDLSEEYERERKLKLHLPDNNKVKLSDLPEKIRMVEMKKYDRNGKPRHKTEWTLPSTVQAPKAAHIRKSESKARLLEPQVSKEDRENFQDKAYRGVLKLANIVSGKHRESEDEDDDEQPTAPKRPHKEWPRKPRDSFAYLKERDAENFEMEMELRDMKEQQRKDNMELVARVRAKDPDFMV